MFLYAVFFLISACVSAHAQNQALNQLVYEIRNPQTDSVHFRQALERIGEYLALDVMQALETKESSITTVTGSVATHPLLHENPVLVTILRAGLPLNAGVHKVFPNSEVGFIGMARNEDTLKAKVDYISLPDLKNRTVILTDTMLATGGSLIDGLKIIEKQNPKRIFVITALASEPGIARALQHNPSIKIFAGTIDPSLNDKGYIVPGLGDAGDRAYGKKHNPH